MKNIILIQTQVKCFLPVCSKSIRPELNTFLPKDQAPWPSLPTPRFSHWHWPGVSEGKGLHAPWIRELRSFG